MEERERGLRHPVVDAIEAEPEYLPDSSSLTAPHRGRREPRGERLGYAPSTTLEAGLRAELEWALGARSTSRRRALARS